MAVKDADPGAQELTDAFSAAMSAPAKPREAPPPPEVDADAPHGRDETGKPLAPHGYNKDGSVRKSAAGRKAKGDQARTGAVAPAGKDTGKPDGTRVPSADYSQALDELADAVWLGLNGLAMAGPHIPVVGRYLPEKPLKAEAYIFDLNRPRLCKALQVAADHNAKAAQTVAKLASGNATWVITCGALVMPFIAQSAAVFKGDEALARFNPDATVETLAAANDAKMDQYMAQVAAMAQEQMAQADASVNGQAPTAA